MNNQQLLAQSGQPIGQIGGSTGFGPFAVFTTGEAAVDAIARVISVVIGFITISAGIYFLFQLFTAALNWMTAAGDKSKLEKSQLQMSQGLTGFIIVVSSYALVSIVGTMLGFNNILLGNPSELLGQLQLGGTK